MLSDGNSGMVMPVAPTGFGNGFGGGFGGDWGAWIVLFLIFGMFGNGGFGGGFGGYGVNYDFPWILNGQRHTDSVVTDGFQNAAVQSAIGDLNNNVVSGFGNVQTALCGGFAGVNATVNNAQNALAQQLYTNQIADLERSFSAQTANTQGMTALQSQLAQCCCDNRLATANLGSDIAREACATRTNDTQNTQAILTTINGGIQSIKDQLAQDKIDAKNDEIATLRQQVAMKDLAASQTAQNAFIAQGFSNEVDQLYNRLNSCPVPTTPVYGRTPIFQCNNGCGCGNNGFVA